MAVAVTKRFPGISSEGKYFVVEVDLAVSGNYATGGDTVDLSALGLPGNAVPFVQIMPTLVAGFNLTYLQGTTLANGKLFVIDDSGAEEAAGAYGAAVTAQAYRALVRVPKFKA